MAHTPFNPERVIDAHELSTRYLPNRSPQTISKDLSRRPHTLPPRLVLPGRQQALWLESEVLAWLRSYQQAPIATQAPASNAPGRRRGRPNKREQISRAITVSQ